MFVGDVRDAVEAVERRVWVGTREGDDRVIPPV